MSLDPAGFDEWYSVIGRSDRWDQVASDALGLPPHLESNSPLGWDALADLVPALRLRPNSLLLDLACGRGGYGLEVARRTGARLIGIDFSGVAIGRARENAASDGSVTAEFRTGRLTDTGLPSGSVDAVLCVDSFQFADPPAAAATECRRVLRPGGRLVLTGWRASSDDARIPERIRRLDLGRELDRAGFVDIALTPRPSWRVAERQYWTTAMEVDPGGDPALVAMQEEGRDVLEIFDQLERISAEATAPG